MHKQINFYDFERAFTNMGRENQFTYEGKRSLFNYLEEYEADTGQRINLDVIALCCEFTEFESLQEFKDQYGDEYESVKDIYNNTIVIPVEVDYPSKGVNRIEDIKVKSFIIQNF